MESLKIRVTLTNTKGWKESKTISLSHYLTSKENGIDILDNQIQNMIDSHNIMEEKTNQNKIENLKWRP